MSGYSENELVERFLYDVVRRLPEKQRKDIEQELNTLIEDMVEERMEEMSSREECVKAVLSELGNPAKLAASYRGNGSCLIGGEYYDSYCYILKIVLICAGVGILVSNIVSAIVHVVETQTINAGIWNDVVNIGNIPMVLVQVFGFITIVYALMERNQVKVNVNEAAWSLEKLPMIPYKKAVISRGESAVGVIFGILIVIMFAFVPQLMGAWFQSGEGMVAIPIFNLAVWDKVMPLFVIAIMAGVIDDLVKLVIGRYSYSVLVVTVIMDTISFFLTFVIFKMFPIWNTNFIPELQKVTGRAFSSKQDVMHYFATDTFTNGFLIIFLCIFLLDLGTTVYRTVRYGNK